MSFSSSKLRSLALHRRIKSDAPKSSQKVFVATSPHRDDSLLPSTPQPSTFLQPELCNICRDVELVKIADRQLNFTTYFLNPKEQQCALCDLVLHFIETLTGAATRQESLLKSEVRLSVEYNVLIVYCGDITRRLGSIEVSRLQGGSPIHYLSSSSIAISKKKAISKPSHINVKQIEGWLHDCAINHEGCSLPIAETLDIFLIDVVGRQIVQKRSDCRYLALSYVWGGVSSFHLTKSNVRTLQKPGALLQHFNRVPQVIQDAMCFTDQLNIRYLWVDSLCIVQDDPVHRDPQISRMNIIYRHAFATIVAMSGHNADCRLPGISLGSRNALQLVRMRKGVELRPLAPDIDLAMDLSTYETRAWTYQERLLSTRCIYFTDWQVYLQCRSNLRSEDGISAMMEESGGGTFQYGLPEAIFDLALLWIPTQPLKRLCPKYDPSSCADYIPSWSWAGWLGPVEHLSGRQNLENVVYSAPQMDLPRLTSEIASFQIERGDEAHSIRRSIGVPYQIITYPEKTYQQPVPSQPSFSGPELCFSAEAVSVVDFRLQKFYVFNVNPRNPIDIRDLVYNPEDTTSATQIQTIICTENGEKVGHLMDNISNCSWGVHGARFEFILLSRTKPEPGGIRTSSGLPCFPVSVEALDEKDVLNVMLIRWTHRGRYAERVAIGLMAKLAWWSANPTRKMIRLI
ncbi:HET-domain-containing protein [Lindgomyces ingoldianus]|uniref:HET-domain-containing protein n=1 Tax=Lindgomyces ingoldianus TaxID=673940 RepID=A0ACB6R460_9PLEO|nr:HET-domain-containing protein [Lindgomyces ingoldianus]KAF2473971.1 HET-domain-containing protein [Lindgomyces ingoldianus]